MSGLGQWAALAQVGSALIQTGAQVYMAKQDRKEAAKNADRQQQMAKDEANRQAKLAADLADRQARVELAKSGLDAQGKPIPGGSQGLVAGVPGGWLTIGGVAAVGLIAVLLLMRRSSPSSAPAMASKTNPRRRH